MILRTLDPERAAPNVRSRRRGAFSAVLLASGIVLLTAYAGVAVEVRPGGCPFAVAPTAAPSAGRAPLLVDFAAGVSSGVPSSYSWSFGDGGYYNGTTSQSARALHEYALPGQYTARLTVVESGCGVTGSVAVSVGAASFVASVRDSPSAGTAPLTVAFNGTASGGTGTYVAFDWTFGDGGEGSGPSLQYTYAVPGTYHVVLDVTDSSGNVTSAGLWLNVSAGAKSNSGPPAFPTAKEWGAITGAGVILVIAVGLLVWNRARQRVAADPAPPFGAPSLRPSEPVPGRADTTAPEATRGPTAPRGADAAIGSSSPPRSTDDLLAPPPRPPSPAPPETLLSQRVVLHMARQGAVRSADVAPNELTQAGMVAGLRANQSSLAHVLRTLEAAGVVSVEVRHARGRARRVKVYVLTPRGESLARELRTGATGRRRSDTD